MHCSRCRAEQVGFSASSVPRIVVDLLFSGVYLDAPRRGVRALYSTRTLRVRADTHRIALAVEILLCPFDFPICTHRGMRCAHRPVIGTMHLTSRSVSQRLF